MKEIDINEELIKFHNHLSLNSRTIFSARFGDGKTYFFQKFFQKYVDDFVPIVIHPVNYSVSNNDDVFEYIKYDILCHLSSLSEFKEIDWDIVRKSIFDYDTLLDEADKLIGDSARGKLLLMPFRLFKKIDDKYAIDKYFDSFNNSRGGIYEKDSFTIIITEVIKRIKNSGKKCICVIEDLDRMDPGHLFRILNVLAAQIDNEVGRNKFGFDNIILTLDYDATRTLFHHFYGNDADYDGYMSKFVMHNPFRYSITHIARKTLVEYLKKDCLVTDSMFVSPLFLEMNKLTSQNKSLRDIIDSLSVRNIKTILDGIENQINNEDIIAEFQGRKHTYNTICPVTRLISVLVRTGVPFKHELLVQMLSTSVETLKILWAFILFEVSGYNDVIVVQKLQYGIDLYHNGKFLDVVYIKGLGGASNTKQAKDVVNHVMEHVYRYVHDSRPNGINIG